MTCDVVGCHETTSGRYLDVRADKALEFRVCAEHLKRIGDGEVPVVVAERLDRAELDGRLALIMDTAD